MKPVKCYASVIGGCSNEQSYEHYVSQGLFNNRLVTVQGQKWAKQPKTVGKDKIGLPILCTEHNKMLSPIDIYGKKVFRMLESCLLAQHERYNFPRSRLWKVDKHLIKGLEFERWMVKAAIGVSFEEKTNKWHLGNSELLNPPKAIIEALFGIKTLNYPMGLYNIISPKDVIEIEDRVHLETLLHPKTDGYMGSIISFRNFDFLIYLHDENLSEYSFISPSGAEFGKGCNLQPQFHPPLFQFNAKGKISSIINFDWNT